MSRVCPVTKRRCSDGACQIFCVRTQGPKGEPEFKEGQLGHPAHKESCRECPLRRESWRGYLGGYTVRDYLTILHSDADIACHMSPGFHEGDHSRQRSCTGVAAYRANVGKLPRGGNAKDSVRLVGPDTETYFATPEEFAKHHDGKE